MINSSALEKVVHQRRQDISDNGTSATMGHQRRLDISDDETSVTTGHQRRWDISGNSLGMRGHAPRVDRHALSDVSWECDHVDVYHWQVGMMCHWQVGMMCHWQVGMCHWAWWIWSPHPYEWYCDSVSFSHSSMKMCGAELLTTGLGRYSLCWQFTLLAGMQAYSC